MPGKTYGRILQDSQHVDYFLRNTLHLDSVYQEDEFNKCVLKLTSAEMMYSKVIGKDTLTDHSYRLGQYSDDFARVGLRKSIYRELTTKKRLIQDDKIKLGSGGALPRTKLKKDKMAFYIIGLPAAGKSELSNHLSDAFGAIILDSDLAKRKFPEYTIDYGATVVHEESSLVVFGGKGAFAEEPSVLQYAVERGCNVIIPKIGDVGEKVKVFAQTLKDFEYKTHLVLVRLDREKATQRAVKRYSTTGRYVPLPLIFDVYANDPTITFYDMMTLDTDQTFSSYTMVSSDVPKKAPKELIYASENSPITKEIL